MTVDACVFRFAVLSVVACHDMEQAKALSHELGLVTRAMADWMFPAKAKTKRKTVQLLASCQCAMRSPMARFYEPLQEIRSVKRAASYARYVKKTVAELPMITALEHCFLRNFHWPANSATET